MSTLQFWFPCSISHSGWLAVLPLHLVTPCIQYSVEKLVGTHHATFVGPTIVVCRDDDDDCWMTRTHHATIVEWPAHTMRRLLNDRTHYATAVGCTHDGRQQLKQIANLVGILYTNSIRSCLLASFFHTQKQWRRFQSMPFYASLRTRWFVGDGGDAETHSPKEWEECG